ncbi:hypothetical protein BC829DRAFT_493894 [Chytridium lagenaria]|nr:hypothetical protein BC829DRAFT_493894 [Chytridium lagenaria]
MTSGTRNHTGLYEATLADTQRSLYCLIPPDKSPSDRCVSDCRQSLNIGHYPADHLPYAVSGDMSWQISIPAANTTCDCTSYNKSYLYIGQPDGVDFFRESVNVTYRFKDDGGILSTFRETSKMSGGAIAGMLLVLLLYLAWLGLVLCTFSDVNDNNANERS